MNELIPFFIIPCLFSLFDILTGVIKGIKLKELSSTKLREGLYHKTGFVLLLCFTGGLNYAQEFIQLGIDIPLLQTASIYIICTETVSILENISKIAPELCGFIDKYFSDKNEDKKE